MPNMKTLKQLRESLLTEKPQQGFEYEKNAAEALKPLNFVPPDFVPAGPGSDRPDLNITNGKKTTGAELKIKDASAGSLVLKWDGKKWSFNKDIEDEEKKFLMKVAEEAGVLEKIDKAWKEKPLKFDKESNLSNREKYEIDSEKFPEIKGEIPAKYIEEYYNTKKTYYVNIGNRGFYMLGTKNPMDFKGVPTFSSAAKAGYRARVQYKGKGNYQFTFEMNFTIPSAKKSPFNIAPTQSTDSVKINTDKIILPSS